MKMFAFLLPSPWSWRQSELIMLLLQVQQKCHLG